MKSDGFCGGKFCRRILVCISAAALAFWTLSQASNRMQDGMLVATAPCKWSHLYPLLWGGSNVLVALLSYGWAHRDLKRLQAALRASRGSLATASHELRGPVNGMLALVELLKEGLRTPEQQRLLSLVQDSGQSLARVLNDILDHASIEAGQFAIERTRVDVRELVDSVTAMLAVHAHRKGLRIRLHVDADVPAAVLTDGNRLRQILVNLIGNGIKYTERGSVSVRVRAADDVDGSVEIVATIADTGIGIAADELRRLFTPFVRARRGARRTEPGTGLGLAIARRLARLLGGDVTLASEEGRGTTATARIRCAVVARGYAPDALAERVVTIDVGDSALAATLAAYARAAGMRLAARGAADVDAVLCDDARVDASRPQIGWVGVTDAAGPAGWIDGGTHVRLGSNPLGWRAFVESLRAALDARDSARARAAAGAQSRAYRVLVVDDQEMNRVVIRYQLDALGHRARLCGSGDEALRALEAGAFDVVLTDCRMPGMDGVALTTAIRAHQDARVRATPIVGVTALVSEGEFARCVAAGMTFCIGKPTTLDALERALVDAIERAPPLRFDPSQIDKTRLLTGFGASPADGAAHTEILLACRRALERDRDTLTRHLRDGLSEHELRAWCHTARGTYSLFGHAHVDALLDEFHHLLGAGDARAIRGAAREILAMVNHLLRCVAHPAQSRDRGDPKGGR
ncbi:ATP-binding protein [Burkholderia oklahomensis]|uniref:Virulence sensor protein BvgS n=3 Tax=Burkholderia oklahomensis TaxID=342113 RepID=A0AAI8FM78_9BURK|nr:ATP-binding protein [Burkholderia oklahomensis]AIO65779.1 response regulator [Burkholderia oklahomensis]AOI42768.1 hybrid sensor histidine kinase/response regulator [Burkholderia oklahomensis EO147]KUY54510.1 hybrid sensor histidine kinase/response regulator [Burkholderia oklahomensis EO147]QPS37508.1 response regulator [Burkholderia oklahomensis]